MEWVWITVATKYKLHIGRNLNFCFAAEAGGPPLLLVLPLSLLALRQTVETCNTLLQPPLLRKEEKIKKDLEIKRSTTNNDQPEPLGTSRGWLYHDNDCVEKWYWDGFSRLYYTRQLWIVYPTTVFSSVLRLSLYVFVSLLFPYWPIMAIPSQYIISWQRKWKQLVDWSNTSNQVISWLCVNLSKWHCTQRTFDLIVRMWSIQRQAIVSLFLLSLNNRHLIAGPCSNSGHSII